MVKIICLALFLAGLASCNADRGKSNSKSEAHAGHVQNPAQTVDYSDSVNAGIIAVDTMKGSPYRVAMETINGTHIHLQYSAPGVKNRIIWGGLVAYDQVWVTGAHQATTVQFSGDVLIDGKKVPAGTYAFFTVPGKEKWVAILNTRHDQHLADDYSESEDVVRLDVQPEPVDMTPRLTYSIVKTDGVSGNIEMAWEKIKISLPFKTTK